MRLKGQSLANYISLEQRNSFLLSAHRAREEDQDDEEEAAKESEEEEDGTA